MLLLDSHVRSTKSISCTACLVQWVRLAFTGQHVQGQLPMTTVSFNPAVQVEMRKYHTQSHHDHLM